MRAGAPGRSGARADRIDEHELGERERRERHRLRRLRIGLPAEDVRGRRRQHRPRRPSARARAAAGARRGCRARAAPSPSGGRIARRARPPGRPSVRRFTVSTWTTVIGTPSPASTATAKSTTSPRFAESRNATKLRMLSVIRRPSRIADDDRREVVVGEHDVGGLAGGLRPAARPIATPTSARRRAGRVVDAVAGHRDDVPRLLERLDDARACPRGSRARTRRASNGPPSAVLVELVRAPLPSAGRDRRARAPARSPPP